MEKQLFDVIVIGGGPGGYVSAIRAAQKGLKTALIEAKEVGGTCLNRGCIPSKALIADATTYRNVKHAEAHGISVSNVSFDYEKMKLRKDKVVERLRKGVLGLINANKITLFEGHGKFTSDSEVKVTGKVEAMLQGKSIVIATGSEPRMLPNVSLDGQKIHDSTSLLEITKLPEKFIVVGGGVIGCEFASLFREFGVDVTIIELLPHILATEGKGMSDQLTASFKRSGIKIETGASVKAIEKDGKVILADGRSFEADMILIAVGRTFNTDNIGLEKTGVALEKNGTIPTNKHMQTNVPHIYAIGDITGKWLLAHVASHQGIVAADHIAGKHSEMSYKAVPSVIFTHPEIGTVGYTLEKAIENGYDAEVGKYPFQALGKAQATLETDGFAQVVVDKKTKAILGAQCFGHEAATLIAEMTLAIENELTAESICETIHAHPTISEAWMEATFLSVDEPIHFPPKVKK